jgi:hypothetical protein
MGITKLQRAATYKCYKGIMKLQRAATYKCYKGTMKLQRAATYKCYKGIMKLQRAATYKCYKGLYHKTQRISARGPVANVSNSYLSGKEVHLKDQLNYVRSEVFTAAIMKNAVCWDVTPFRSCWNRHFEGTCSLHIQGRENLRARNNASYC